MEVCSWNWGAIGSFVAAGATVYAAHIALLISNQWRSQKGSEVLAISAKNAIIEIENLDDQLLYIGQRLSKYQNHEDLKLKITEIDRKQLNNLLNFISTLIDQDTSKLITQYNKKYIHLSFRINFYISNINSNENENEERLNMVFEKYEIYSLEKDLLIEKLKDYALYKKTI
jgi:hypothetical protein